jgi:hypothetical protein
MSAAEQRKRRVLLAQGTRVLAQLDRLPCARGLLGDCLGIRKDARTEEEERIATKQIITASGVVKAIVPVFADKDAVYEALVGNNSVPRGSRVWLSPYKDGQQVYMFREAGTRNYFRLEIPGMTCLKVCKATSGPTRKCVTVVCTGADANGDSNVIVAVVDVLNEALVAFSCIVRSSAMLVAVRAGVDTIAVMDKTRIAVYRLRPDNEEEQLGPTLRRVGFVSGKFQENLQMTGDGRFFAAMQRDRKLRVFHCTPDSRIVERVVPFGRHSLRLSGSLSGNSILLCNVSKNRRAQGWRIDISEHNIIVLPQGEFGPDQLEKDVFYDFRSSRNKVIIIAGYKILAIVDRHTGEQGVVPTTKIYTSRTGLEARASGSSLEVYSKNRRKYTFPNAICSGCVTFTADGTFIVSAAESSRKKTLHVKTMTTPYE